MTPLPETMNRTLKVLVKAEPDGPCLGQERVTLSDLTDLLSELWLHAFLRKGHTAVPLDAVRAEVIPDFPKKSGARCAGFWLEAACPDGQTFRRHFSLRSLAHVARRAASVLRESGALAPAARSFYEVQVAHGRCPPADPCADGSCEIEVQRPPLTCLRMPLAPLLAQATRMGEADAEDCNVFFTQAAFAQAERCSRRGAGFNPPVETGGVLAGSLCGSPCGEFFVVVTDVLEATDALQSSYSLGYSDQTWNRIQAAVRARQRSDPERGYRLVGNCHGHNFLPNLSPTAGDSASCHNCHQRQSCLLTSVFASEDDQIWSKAVFARQPWQLTHIFGLTARGEPVHKLFGLRDGRLQPRGFHLLSDFPGHDAWQYESNLRFKEKA
jgi:hypothetical protein